MMVLPGYSADELEKQYNIRLARPDLDSAVIPDWTRRSAEFRARAKGSIDLAYGERPRERLDFFPAGDNDPVLVFFHGGYWQRFDKSVFSFIAAPFVQNGVSVAVVNYDLCPSVRMSDIPPQTRRAVGWIWRNAAELGFSRERVFVSGNSAGGHITAMVMATHWREEAGGGLPADLVKGGIPISGLFELEPLRHTSINKGLGMDASEAASQSPINVPPATDAPQLVVCGADESAEFHRQSDRYAHIFTTPARRMERYTVPGRDHLTVADELADESTVLFEKALKLVGS
ncbi:alpha/beta hydrolase [Mesorhizobium sp. CO1-1-8]|uniref:alpha/beta hydrolase n=1 Tax=Mesorhizobium sp. CO1-1-8 TaxID=2876631 RepID=UPI001CD1759A|nr:alpha/beta hydrolase [Mesorhizobium sp. CO1-1-8]MBZ9772245.1 alpha/beta hydrolase [Mesorhizobium sp. CO1-1-8]